MTIAANAPSILEQTLAYFGITGAKAAADLPVLEAVADSEGAPGSRENPLDTTKPGYGGVSINSVGVKQYPTAAAGAAATAATLAQSNFAVLLAGLQAGRPASYYTSGAAAKELELWQGGSTLAVRLLGGKVVSVATSPSSDSNPIDAVTGAIGGAATAVGGALGTVAGTATGTFAAGFTEGALSGVGAAARAFFAQSSGSVVPIVAVLVVTLILWGGIKGGGGVPTINFAGSGGSSSGGSGAPLAATQSSPLSPNDEDFYAQQLEQDKADRADEHRSALAAGRLRARRGYSIYGD